MKHFPLFASLQGRAVLVVGAGQVAERKVRSLLSAGASVTVGALRFGPRLQLLSQCGALSCLRGPFSEHWLDGQWLVVAATDDRVLNARVAAAAEARRLFCNVVDDPALSSVQIPSVVDRAPFTVAIASGGAAPALARRLREWLESMLDPALGLLGELAQRRRAAIRKALPDLGQRRRFYDWMLDGPVFQALRQRQPPRAESLLDAALADGPASSGGLVSLVGAGSGDPGLLTLAALRAMTRADVVLHDRLVGEDVLALARRDALRIYVGKRPGEDHEATQARIHRLMVDHARQGRHVVRLKGGDAFIFGRGGEELEHLADHGVAYEVLPGVTAALACAAYAGVPLTHRQHAHSLRLLTLHRSTPVSDAEWADMARPGQTLAFYMAAGELPWLADRLVAHGCAPDTPFALVENGTLPSQRVLHGTLRSLADQAHERRAGAPAMLLVGAVAALGRRLAWFGTEAAPPGRLLGGLHATRAEAPAGRELPALR